MLATRTREVSEVMWDLERLAKQNSNIQRDVKEFGKQAQLQSIAQQIDAAHDHVHSLYDVMQNISMESLQLWIIRKKKPMTLKTAYEGFKKGLGGFNHTWVMLKEKDAQIDKLMPLQC